MAFDVFVTGFEEGAPRDADATVVEAGLAPYVVARDGSYARLRVGDDESDLYGMDRLHDGFMVNHTGPAVFDVVVDVAKAADLVILLPMEHGTAVTRESQRAHLPADLVAEGVTLVTTGEELRRLIGGYATEAS